MCEDAEDAESLHSEDGLRHGRPVRGRPASVASRVEPGAATGCSADPSLCYQTEFLPLIDDN